LDRQGGQLGKETARSPIARSTGGFARLTAVKRIAAVFLHFSES
jgi:hypothetical protein